MSRKIQILRGEAKDLKNVTLDVGELAWVMDEKKLYIGTGEGMEELGFGPELTTHNVSPAEDVSYTVGSPTKRYTTVHTQSGVTTTSDQRMKENIEELNLGLEFVSGLSPKSYNLKGTDQVHFGLIAQDVEKLLAKNKVDGSPIIEKHEGTDGDSIYSMRYDEIIPLLVNSINELSAELGTLKQTIAELTEKES